MCPQMPIVVTHTMNVFGERQNPEKFIPGVLSAVMNGEQVGLKIRAGGQKKEFTATQSQNQMLLSGSTKVS